ncbi:MAG: nucleotide pyrophosphohydrolase [Planctomycetota bacterium]|nr:MAG: nucleotide pyrophosphohydrolase [Planctomycetota bacterium]
MEIKAFQKLIEDIYGKRDGARGIPANFTWLMEEIGELARAIRKGDKEQIENEFADVLAWTVTIANILGIDCDRAVQAKYGTGCPRCGSIPCSCV